MYHVKRYKINQRQCIFNAAGFCIKNITGFETKRIISKFPRKTIRFPLLGKSNYCLEELHNHCLRNSANHTLNNFFIAKLLNFSCSHKGKKSVCTTFKHTPTSFGKLYFKGPWKTEDFCTTPNSKEVLLLTWKWLYWYSHVTSRVEKIDLSDPGFSQSSSNL